MLLLGLHHRSGEFPDLQQPDVAMIAQGLSGGVAQPDAVRVDQVVVDQAVDDQPDGTGGRAVARRGPGRPRAGCC